MMKIPLTFLFLCVFLAMPSLGFFLGTQLQTLCINTQGLLPGQPPVQIPGQVPTVDPGAQVVCVRCNAQRFSQIATACTGQPVVPPNTSPNQAFCLVSNCIQQNPQKAFSIPGLGGLGGAGGQFPGLPGRRKRRDIHQMQNFNEKDLEGAVYTNIELP